MKFKPNLSSEYNMNGKRRHCKTIEFGAFSIIYFLLIAGGYRWHADQGKLKEDYLASLDNRKKK